MHAGCSTENWFPEISKLPSRCQFWEIPNIIIPFPLRQKCDNTHKKDTLQAHYKHLESFFLSSQVYFQAFSSGEIQAREKEQEQWIKYSKKVVKQRKKKERKKEDS